MNEISNNEMTVYLTEDGAWFQFSEDGEGEPMRLVVSPDESIYSYSHGGARYRAAIEMIAKWKEENDWGITK